MAPELRVRDPVELQQLERLRVVASGHGDLVPALLEDLDDRPEHEHMRRRRHVDPDPHVAGSSRSPR